MDAGERTAGTKDDYRNLVEVLHNALQEADGTLDLVGYRSHKNSFYYAVG